MADDRLADGKRIAQLLASEIDGLGGVLERVGIVDANPDVDPTTDGAFAYAVAIEGGIEDEIENSAGDGTEPARVAEVYVQPDRARVEFAAKPDVAADAAAEQDLRVRPKASRPPRTLVFVEDGAEVKRAVPVVKAVVDAVSG